MILHKSVLQNPSLHTVHSLNQGCRHRQSVDGEQGSVLTEKQIARKSREQRGGKGPEYCPASEEHMHSVSFEFL